MHDYLVVGSGCSGAMVAQTLIDSGASVTMIDVGITDKQYTSQIPDKDFEDIRTTEKDQYKYLIGEHGEGIAWGKIGKGAQVTPPRQYMTKLVDKYLPMQTDTFSPLESLAYGGLGAGWGLQCWEFSKADMKRAGLPEGAMRQAYEVVSKRIGISATADDAAGYTIGSLKNYQASPDADRNHQYILNRYRKHAARFKNDGLYIGRTPLALVTDDTDERQGYQYRGLDFYSNHGNSAWRPDVTVNQLRKDPKFTYKASLLVIRFTEKGDHTEVECLDTNNAQKVTLRCRKLVLASGALGSARIMLRSLGQSGSRLPLLSNPHTYVPCLQPAMMGKGLEPHKLGLGQLSYFLDPTSKAQGLSVASSYSYQSLMLFRIINQFPLNFADSRILLNYLMSGLVIMIVQHPDEVSKAKYVELAAKAGSPTGDTLNAHYALKADEESTWTKREKQYIAAMRKLRTYALKRVPTEHGSAIHYAGTIPFSSRPDPLTLSPSGRVNGLKNVFVADSAGFNYLPAPGLTFSLMANAHLVAKEVLKG